MAGELGRQKPQQPGPHVTLEIASTGLSKRSVLIDKEQSDQGRHLTTSLSSTHGYTLNHPPPHKYAYIHRTMQTLHIPIQKLNTKPNKKLDISTQFVVYACNSCLTYTVNTRPASMS